ncbi:hypothetical protein GCM10028803_30110 [Larkinella knui]|uniref:High-potential iron-sulfur protein n=1 Tax=Larkinella knui TaxID=2025310 RepID=A0A3P1CY65_9BACT|nr:high-potential iron-sulfur protein [Larkinella knui]RRB18040.1 high-potential iron-sulfur protein [Larkinella knui]
MRDSYSRRKFIEQIFAIGPATLGAGLLISSCQSETSSKQEEPKSGTDPCKDFSGVSENDLNTRKKLGYVDKSPQPESKCGNCNLFLPPKVARACGGCLLFKGPVLTSGYCTYWAPISK